MSKNNKGIPGSLRAFFGIFMIFVYFGMAYLLLINFFDWSQGFAWFRYLAAAILGIYGLYRAYRQIKGIDYYRLRSDASDEPQESDARLRTEQLIERVKQEQLEKEKESEAKTSNDESKA